MPRVELSAGPIDYTDTGGTGPVLAFGHGFPMSGTQWRKVVPLLDGCRCVLPTLPLGAHRAPMRPDADLSQFGVARLLGEFLAALDLHEATIVVNDWGGGQFLVADGLAPAEHVKRAGRLAPVACEAFDNFPPKPARPVVNLLRLPGGSWLRAQATRRRSTGTPRPRTARCAKALSRTTFSKAGSPRRCETRLFAGTWSHSPPEPTCSPAAGWSRSRTAAR